MCARYTLRTPAEDLQSLFELDSLEPYEIRSHAAPTDRMPIVRLNSEGHRVLETLRWGLIPFWAKDIAAGRSTFNARSESIFEKPSFREAILRRRCLVPADGFIEWKEVEESSSGGLFGDTPIKRSKPHKVPHWIGMGDRRTFAFAGVYDRWRSPSGETIRSFSILTGPPNPLVATIHDRMPIILPPDSYAAWIDRNLAEPSEIETMLQPYPAEGMALEPC